MNIDDMSGADLDALAATSVMGWHTDPGLYGETAFLYPPEWEEELHDWPSKHGRQQATPHALVPSYSSGSDLLAVLLKALGEGLLVVLSMDEDGKHRACVRRSMHHSPYGVGVAPTLPLALVRAICKAKEANDGK